MISLFIYILYVIYDAYSIYVKSLTSLIYRYGVFKLFLSHLFDSSYASYKDKHNMSRLASGYSENICVMRNI
jgi:hypothetical protein